MAGWLQLVIKFTCARLGLLLVEIDGAVAEPEKLKAILNEHKAKVRGGGNGVAVPI